MSPETTRVRFFDVNIQLLRGKNGMIQHGWTCKVSKKINPEGLRLKPPAVTKWWAFLVPPLESGIFMLPLDQSIRCIHTNPLDPSMCCERKSETDKDSLKVWMEIWNTLAGYVVLEFFLVIARGDGRKISNKRCKAWRNLSEYWPPFTLLGTTFAFQSMWMISRSFLKVINIVWKPGKDWKLLRYSVDKSWGVRHSTILPGKHGMHLC